MNHEAGMSGEELKAKYEELQPGDHWAEHPEFSLGAWREEVSEENTLQGYWDWVAAQAHEANMTRIEQLLEQDGDRIETVYCSKKHPHGSAYVAVTAQGRWLVGREQALIDVFYGSARVAYDAYFRKAEQGDHGAWNICYVLEDHL